MTPLTTTAVAMVNAPVAEVHRVLADYQDARPELLTEHFDGYRLCAGGQGAGTEVHWTLLLGRPRERRRRKWPPWDCRVLVEEPGNGRIVERDTRSDLVTTWSVVDGGDRRSVVRVRVDWSGPPGVTKLPARAGQRLAMRQAYEGMLTKLHQRFGRPNGDEDEY